MAASPDCKSICEKDLEKASKNNFLIVLGIMQVYLFKKAPYLKLSKIICIRYTLERKRKESINCKRDGAPFPYWSSYVKKGILITLTTFSTLKVRYLYEKHQISIWCMKKDDYDPLLFAL
jgi:hypothetical protein